MSREFFNICDERIDQQYDPLISDDGRKLIVAVGSGGMSGSVSSGALLVAQEHGYLEVVDGFTGSSIGAVTAAYAATGNLGNVEASFIDPLTDSKFMSNGFSARLASYLKFKLDRSGDVPAPQNMDLISQIIRDDLDIDSLKSAKVPILASVTSLPDLDIVIRDLRKLNDEQIVEFLTRGCAFPFVSGDYKGVDGIVDSAIDGAFTLPASEQLALTLDPTHILSISNSPYEEPSYGHLKRISRRLIGLWLAYDTRAGIDIYSKFVSKGLEQAEYLKSFRPSSFILNGALVETVAPFHDENLPGRLTMDPEKLRRGIEIGRQAMLTAARRS